MGLMKEKFIQQREQEEYEQETLELYYKHLLLLSDENYVAQTETINEIKK